MRRAAVIGVGVVLLAGVLASPARAELFDLQQWGTQIAGGYASSEDVQYYALQPHFGFGVWAPVAERLDRIGIEALWVIEPWVALVRDDEGPFRTTSFEIGVSPIFFRFTLDRVPLRPFLEGGEGVLYTDLRGQKLGTRIQFSSQFGVGLQYELTETARLTLAARYRHISNAGLASSNKGIDTVYGLLGVTFR